MKIRVGILVLLLLWCGGARAADIVGFYAASWAGLPAGKIRLKLSQERDTYRDEIAIESEGLPRWFTKFKGTGAAEGRLLADGRARPLRYDALYDLRKRHGSRISMRFVDRDGATIAERGPADTSRKGPLPEVYRRDVVDPVAALANIRHRLLAAPPHAGDHFSVPVYDGARRFDVAVAVTAVGGPDAVVRLRLTVAPIAGFKGETSEDEDPDTAPRPVDVTFSNDGRLMPESMRVSIYFLPLTVEFRHFCVSMAACTEDGH